MEKILKGILASTTGTLIYFLGGWDKTLEILLIMVVIDFTTGVIKGASQGKLSSKISFPGIFKKFCIGLVVVMAHQIDIMLNQDNVVRYWTCMFYIVNEGISFLENISALNLPIPPIIQNTLTKILNSQ